MRSSASTSPCPACPEPCARDRAAAARSKTPATPTVWPGCSTSPSMSGTSPRGSRKTSSMTSSPSTRPGGPRTRACAAMSASSSPPSSTARWPWASTPSPPATTPRCAGMMTASPDSAASATVHSAGVFRDDAGRPELHRGADLAKDQSYVLGVLPSDQLEHCYFPIGATASKAEVRAEAAERGFSVASKPDSYDICFIPDGDTKAWLADKIPMRPGLIKDSEGEVLGEHDGAMTYTIGQRKGLGIQKPAPDGKPRFVTGLDPATNTVTVGSRADLAVSHLTGIRTSWAGAAPADMGQSPQSAIDCEVQIRAHADPVPARA